MKSCQPPDPNTKIPSIKLPPGACDAHCHIFGPGNKFPYHPNRSYTPPDATKEGLKTLHQKLGIDRAVIVQATCHGNDNRAMLDAIQHSDGSYRGIAMVDEYITEKHLLALDEGGVRGTRFSFARHLSGPPDFNKVRMITEKYAALGWHAVLYLEADDMVEFSRDLINLPVPIVIDHMARFKVENGIRQKPFQLLLKLLQNEDFWVKISGAERLSKKDYPYADIKPYVKALIEAAPDKVIWGTDWPHPNITGKMPNDGELVDMLNLYTNNIETLKRIMVDNPEKLYGF